MDYYFPTSPQIFRPSYGPVFSFSCATLQVDSAPQVWTCYCILLIVNLSGYESAAASLKLSSPQFSLLFRPILRLLQYKLQPPWTTDLGMIVMAYSIFRKSPCALRNSIKLLVTNYKSNVLMHSENILNTEQE